MLLTRQTGSNQLQEGKLCVEGCLHDASGHKQWNMTSANWMQHCPLVPLATSNPRRRATLKQTLPSSSGVMKLMSARIWHRLGEQNVCACLHRGKKLLFDCTTSHLQQRKKKGTGIGIKQHADSSPPPQFYHRGKYP